MNAKNHRRMAKMHTKIADLTKRNDDLERAARSTYQLETLLGEAETALTAGRSVNQEAVDKNLGIIKQYKPRVASMLKAYCK